MKNVTVIIPPPKFEAVKKKLMDMGINGITISECEGYGFQKRKIDVLEGKDVGVEFMPKVKIEMVLKDADAEGVVSAIIDITRTGRIGDGKIFISDVADVVRIRTGERGEFAV
ncbi:MAG: P-II family nitrogen regulator [Spirochaetia bacterium]|nr:P-II family nitrogen regulator [Spirochaetia bacterium]